MYKILIATLPLLTLAACSNFKVTPAMCDQIRSEHGEIPQECRAYSQEAADKAFDKVKEDKKISNKDIIEFHKEK